MNSIPQTPQILCIGSVLWDIIGRAPVHMRQGSDVAGRITRLPGGVALNIAMTLARFGLMPSLLSAVGRDAEGKELVAACTELGLNCDYLYRSADLPTDVYMAVEGANGLISAIADAHSLEMADEKILAALKDGRLGTVDMPFSGVIALDGNLTTSLLGKLAKSALFAAADLRIAPASPGKAQRLLALLDHPAATIYVNREEAGLICQSEFDDSASAAKALVAKGAARVLVTDGAENSAVAFGDMLLTQKPPQVMVTRVTGAGDTFMAAHIAAEVSGADNEDALTAALTAAANYVSGRVE